jgi:hypothetical protein
MVELGPAPPASVVTPAIASSGVATASATLAASIAAPAIGTATGTGRQTTGKAG